MNRFKQVVSALGVSMVLALVSAQASAGLDLRFSFLSESPFYDGLVSGTIFGLVAPDAGISSATTATSVLLDQSPATSPITFSSFTQNSFSIFSPSAGVFEVDSFSLVGDTNGVALCLDDLARCSGGQGSVNAGNFAGLDDQGNPIGDPTTFAFAASVDFATVPAPAPFTLLALGLLFFVVRARGRSVDVDSVSLG